MIELSSDSEDGPYSEPVVDNVWKVDTVSNYRSNFAGMLWEESSSSEGTSEPRPRFHVEQFIPESPCGHVEVVIEEDQRHGDKSNVENGATVSDNST